MAGPNGRDDSTIGARLRIDDRSGTLRLRYACDDAPFNYDVPLETTALPSGGRRWRFQGLRGLQDARGPLGMVPGDGPKAPATTRLLTRRKARGTRVKSAWSVPGNDLPGHDEQPEPDISNCTNVQFIDRQESNVSGSGSSEAWNKLRKNA